MATGHATNSLRKSSVTESAMIIQVELKETRDIDPFDFRTWQVAIPCGDGSQQLGWLAFAACLRMALTTGDVPSKFVPQVVMLPDGRRLDPRKRIKDCFQDGSEAVIECSSGPTSFTLNCESNDLDARNHAVDFNGEYYPCLTEMDQRKMDSDGAKGVLDMIDWSSYGIKDGPGAKAVLSPYVGFFQALLIWYSCQGKELEDKDFGLLNENQFLQIFQPTRNKIDENCLVQIFWSLIKGKGKGKYQLTMLEFFPAVIHVASELFKCMDAQVSDNNSQFSQTLIQLIKVYLVPSLESHLMPYLKDLQTIARKECLNILKDSRESLILCLKACKPNSMIETPSKLPFQLLLPFLRKWLVLGKSWNPQLVAVLVINAFQKNIKEIQDLVEIPMDLGFGAPELQEFLLGAAHFCHAESVSPIRISDKSYLQEYLKQLFARASVARPLYTTYDEKKDYLRSILLSKEEVRSAWEYS